MVEKAVKHVVELLKDDSSRLLDVNLIRECLENADMEGIAEKVFTNVAKCIQTQEDVFECIPNLVLLAANVFNVTYVGAVADVIRLICNVFSFICGTSSFTAMSVNKPSGLSEKMDVIEEKLHAFYTRFDARRRDLKSFKEEKEKTKGRVVKLLDDAKYKEIGLGFTGELEAIIPRYTSVREEEILKSVGEILNVYVRVAIMRRVMQISILSIISDEEMESAIKRIKEYIENDALRRVAFLTRILEPSHENAIFLSSFSITELPHLHMFLKTEGFITEEQPWVQEVGALLTNKIIALHPVVFQCHWMNSAAFGYVWSTSTAPHDDDAQFRFEVVSEEDNIFFIKSFKRQTYIYMKPDSFLSQTDIRPKEEGMFKVLPIANDKCLIAIIKYPGRFIYMQNTMFGRIKASEADDEYSDGLPSEQHEWSLKEVRHRWNGNEVHTVEKPQIASLPPFPKIRKQPKSPDLTFDS